MDQPQPSSLADRFCLIIDGLLAALAAQGFLTRAMLFLLRPRLERLRDSFRELAEQLANLTPPAAPLEADPVAADPLAVDDSAAPNPDLDDPVPADDTKPQRRPRAPRRPVARSETPEVLAATLETQDIDDAGALPNRTITMSPTAPNARRDSRRGTIIRRTHRAIHAKVTISRARVSAPISFRYRN